MIGRVGEALVGLLGAVVGVAGTLFVASRTNKAAQELSERERREERLREVIALAADAFSLALTAVSWMGATTVEDSVNPTFASRYEPKSREAEEAVREAQVKLNTVSALQGDNDLGGAAGRVAKNLGSLLYAWETTQDARRQTMEAPKESKWGEAWFMKNFNRLNEVRLELTGVDDHELDPGLPGSAISSESSLGQLRRAIAAV